VAMHPGSGAVAATIFAANELAAVQLRGDAGPLLTGAMLSITPVPHT